MKKTLMLLTLAFMIWATVVQAANPNYAGNRAPLAEKPYIQLPLGSIKARGWLHQMLERQAVGATGHMDELYPQVMGPRNGWLGGDGDQWERGPYWIDGLLPLAYQLDDKALQDKVQPWVEWAIGSQREDGFFGPATDYPGEQGIQRDNSHDWWPRMVVLKILQQYYSATGDQRVIDMFTNYFRYQLNTLPEKSLGHWTFWAEHRACDNLQAVYWLYNITGDSFLLDLGNLIHKQSFNLAGMAKDGSLSHVGSVHCVNVAQGLKMPVVYFQQSHKHDHIEDSKDILRVLRDYHGYPNGMYGGDEAMHGDSPTQGVELCSVVEMMYSLEQMVEITGDIAFADHLERVAFNALPTQITDDFMNKQYYQQSNQVGVTLHRRNFDQDHSGTANLMGQLTGYPCCFSNMHQGWPKFTQNLWYATTDNGLAAMVYSPSEVTAKVADGQTVTITEETLYPMDDKIAFVVTFPKKRDEASFPLKLRIPEWCKNAGITVNGQPLDVEAKAGSVAVVDRTWKSGDRVELTLPMEIRSSEWAERSVAIERGPLVYALKLDEKWEEKQNPENLVRSHGKTHLQVTTDDTWNYGFVDFDRGNPSKTATVIVDPEKQKAAYPWNVENAPVEIRIKAKQVPYWTRYNDDAGQVPYSPTYWSNHNRAPEEQITLIPYGCTTLRIAQFPVIR